MYHHESISHMTKPSWNWVKGFSKLGWRGMLVPSILSQDNGNEKRIFLCRMNVSRNARRQMRFGDQKVTYFYEVEEYHTKSYKFKECLEQDWVKSSKKRKIKITHLFFGGQSKAD